MKITIVFFLKLVAILIVASTFLKSLIDIDRSFDTWAYHLPFAARLANIIPSESYLFSNWLEFRFQGFPLLADLLQGIFWLAFGRVQAANLVSFLSLILYIIFLKKYFYIPLYFSTIALFAIPTVQIHSTSSYVDLPGNISLSILIMMTYLFYVSGEDSINKKKIFLIIISATIAANTKFQLIPLVFLFCCLILWKFFVTKYTNNLGNERKSKVVFIFLSSLIGLLIFATPVKNVAFYGNPLYPVELKIAGITLNYKEPEFVQVFPENIPKFQRWFYSIIEYQKPGRFGWSIDQYNSEPNYHRMGGFFGEYIVFHLLLFAYITYQARNRETLTACLGLIFLSIVTFLMPRSYYLRYYMYWGIILVSINLYLVCRFRIFSKNVIQKKIINPKIIGIICLLFLTYVLAVTRARHIRPTFYSLQDYRQEKISKKILNQIQAGDRVCIVGEQPHTLLYTTQFNPQLDLSYSVKEANQASDCGSYKLLNSRD